MGPDIDNSSFCWKDKYKLLSFLQDNLAVMTELLPDLEYRPPDQQVHKPAFQQHQLHSPNQLDILVHNYLALLLELP